MSMHYFFHDMIKIKNLDPNKFKRKEKINEKSHKNILINYLLCDTKWRRTFVPCYELKKSGYIEKSNGN